MAVFDGCTAYWPLEETSGVATDIVNGNTLTSSGSVGSGAGKIGNARGPFPSGGAFHLQSPPVNINMRANWSCAFWFRAGSVNTVLMSTSTLTNLAFLYYTSITSMAFYFTNGQVTVGNLTVPVNTWHYLVMTWESGVNIFRLYVNGQEAISFWRQSSDFPDLTQQSLIFGTYQNGSLQLNGLIDEIAFWNRALSEAEVTELYNSGAGLAYHTCGASFPLIGPGRLIY